MSGFPTETNVIGRVSFKPYCSAKQAINAIVAFEDILSRGIDPKRIDSVTVHVPTDFARMIGHGVEPGDRMSSISSAPYQLAIAAFEHKRLFDSARETIASSPAITAFMTKVSVVPHAELDDHLPECWPASVEVKIGSRSETTLVLEAPGDPSRPYSFDDVARKFHTVADRIIGAAEVDRIISRRGLPR
jgi:2-methylcitrate dehydratase PrpD